jgi:Flp pilus assembly protein TadD
LLRQGDQTGAVAAFRRAILGKPNYSDAHRDLGGLLAQRGQIAEAVAQLGYARRLDPADAKSKQLLEQVLPRIALSLGP